MCHWEQTKHKKISKLKSWHLYRIATSISSAEIKWQMTRNKNSKIRLVYKMHKYRSLTEQFVVLLRARCCSYPEQVLLDCAFWDKSMWSKNYQPLAISLEKTVAVSALSDVNIIFLLILLEVSGLWILRKQSQKI